MPGPVVAAASGGADSAALAAVLGRVGSRLGLEVHLAHVDHRMRASSVEDAAVARRLAEKLGLPFHLREVQVGAEGGPEASARRARYAALGELARELSAGAVAVGHTRTDQAETVLLRLLRGAGARGLAAMAAERPLGDGVRLVRPLLGFSREEVRGYAASLGLPTHEDPTNADPRFRRNALRRLWPALLALSPQIERRLAQLASLSRDDEQALDDLAAAALETLAGRTVELRAASLAALPRAVSRRVLRRLARRASPGAQPSAAQIDRMLALVSRKAPGRAHVAGDLEASLGRGVFRLEPRLRELPPAPFSVSIAGEGRWPCPEAGLVLSVARAQVDGSTDPDLLYLSTEVARFPLTLRNRHPGDRFHPQGAPGSRKLKRFLIDGGVPRARRDRLALLCDGEQILWVVGVRPAEQARRPPIGAFGWRLRAEPTPELS
ncbi:MAG: tRNA lysidine(34) synthetase TilS [Myxococcales bacterium]